MENRRDLSFDFIKGVLIFLVVFGHCLNEMHTEHTQGTVDLWINSFHMPLFMFVSGWFAWRSLDKGFVSTLRTKLHRLAVPALIWSTVIFVQRIAMGEAMTLRLFYDSCRGMWFLWCLTGLFCLSALIWQSKHHGTVALCVAVALLMLYPWYPNDLLKHFKIALHFPSFFLGAWFSARSKGASPPYSLESIVRQRVSRL